MKNKFFKSQVATMLFLLLWNCSVVSAQAPLVPYVFTGTVSGFTRTLSPGTNVESDRTSALQSLIDEVSANSGGGTVYVNSGDYRFKNVYLKSNVFLLFDKGAVIKSFFSNGNTGLSVTIFNLGRIIDDGSTNIISNVKVGCSNCGVNEKVSINADGATGNFKAFGISQVQDFSVSNFSIVDNGTKIAGIVFAPTFNGYYSIELYTNSGTQVFNSDGSPAMHDIPTGVSWSPLNGELKDLEILNAHPGYGLVQAQSCRNISFKNMRAVGGSTLRLESGATIALLPANIDQNLGVINDIYAEAITSEDGRNAILFQPHTRINGRVVAKNIRSIGSAFAVYAPTGFLDADIGSNLLDSDPNYVKGYYKDITIDDVVATYKSNTAQLESDFQFYPQSYRDQSPLNSLPLYDNDPKLKIGPSIAVIGHRSVNNVTQQQQFENGTILATGTREDPLGGKFYLKMTNISGIGFTDPIATCSVNLHSAEGYPSMLFGDDFSFGFNYNCSNLSTENFNSDKNISVVPNPASTSVTVTAPINSEINIYNTLGALLKSVQSNALESKINVSDLSAGIYFVSIALEGQKTVKKLIIE
ncbi:T9SS type A sorting domain-containing protein [Flavobacterium ovatum]|uniref:T9SS type A sorting domain-containing protein n=1 Tax=Flavobacterium ovatum TaxID=1928857 RepID=UPI00344E9BE2